MGSNQRHDALTEGAAARLRVEVADGLAGAAPALDLRRELFRAGRIPDHDAHDPLCRHVMIRDVETGVLAACFRTRLFQAERLGDSYAGQHYDLSRLSAFPSPLAEVGRFCVAPAYCDDIDVLRKAWAAITEAVDANRIGMLFGCASFPGTDPVPHAAGLSLLARRIAPRRWRPGRVAAETVTLDGTLGVASVRGVPPLLRSYLTMGGWVSDHAVIDRDLGTLHVFTGLEVQAVPAARASALRRLAG